MLHVSLVSSSSSHISVEEICQHYKSLKISQLKQLRSYTTTNYTNHITPAGNIFYQKSQIDLHNILQDHVTQHRPVYIFLEGKSSLKSMQLRQLLLAKPPL